MCIKGQTPMQSAPREVQSSERARSEWKIKTKNHGVNSSATSAAPDMRKEMALCPHSYAYAMSNTGGDCVMACGFLLSFFFFFFKGTVPDIK